MPEIPVKFTMNVMFQITLYVVKYMKLQEFVFQTQSKASSNIFQYIIIIILYIKYIH